MQGLDSFNLLLVTFRSKKHSTKQARDGCIYEIIRYMGWESVLPVNWYARIFEISQLCVV